MMDKFNYYEYEVLYWDEIENEEATARGVVCVGSFSDAAGALLQFYGESVSSIKITELFYESCVLELNEESLEVARKHNC
jgi:hypothetical protein